MRARNLKPGFFKNEDLADIDPPWGRVLFAGLWCLADREGRIEDRPRRIKAEVFPYDEKIPSIEKMLSQLTAKNFIIRYTVSGEKVIQINKFKAHQNPHNTERQSTLPAPPINGELTVNPPLSNGENLADSLNPDSLNPDSLIPDSLENPLSPEATAAGAKNSRDLQTLARLWNENAPATLSRVNLPLKRSTKDLRPIIEALKRNPSPEWWVALFRVLPQRPHLIGMNDRGWKANFDFVVSKAELIMDGKYADTPGHGSSMKKASGPMAWLAEQEQQEAESHGK